MGTYAATIGTAGYVTFDGQPGATKTGISVTAGSLQQVNFSYDKSAALTAVFATDGEHLLPSPLPGLRYRSRSLVLSHNLVLKCSSQRGRLRLRRIVQDKSSRVSSRVRGYIA